MKQQLQNLLQHSGDADKEAAYPLDDLRAQASATSLRALERASELQREAFRRDVAQQLAQHQNAVHEELSAGFKQQDRRLLYLTGQIEELSDKQGKGGFPWLLIGLIGAGVYVWRTPKIRSQLLEWLGQVSPQARDTAEQLGDRAGQAVDDIKSGTPPGEAVKDAASDMGQQVKDAAQDVRKEAQHRVDDLKTERQG